jgi:GDP-4-dehydro-6-deoxy-D-mannose reductase
MRIFVTGAGGFVGRRLVPALADDHHEVMGSDRDVDVTDRTAVQRAFEQARPDAIIHLAALSSVAASWQQAERCYRVNFLGTRNVLSSALSAAPDARVLLIGSADEYGASAPRPLPLDESAPLHPRSPYARTKTAGERLGELARRRGLDVVRVRAFNHTGAGQNDAFVVSSFARQVAAISQGRQAPLMRVGNLESVRDFLHVDDVIRAYQQLLDPTVPADVYNVASGRATPIQEVLDGLIELAQISPRVERDPARHRPTDWLVGDASRLRKATGWQPQRSLHSILEELLSDWLAREGA